VQDKVHYCSVVNTVKNKPSVCIKGEDIRDHLCLY
jgi:hypothetical protein